MIIIKTLPVLPVLQRQTVTPLTVLLLPTPSALHVWMATISMVMVIAVVVIHYHTAFLLLVLSLGSLVVNFVRADTTLVVLTFVMIALQSWAVRHPSPVLTLLTLFVLLVMTNII